MFSQICLTSVQSCTVLESLLLTGRLKKYFLLQDAHDFSYYGFKTSFIFWKQKKKPQ